MNRRMGVQISMDDKYQSLNEMQKRAVFQTEGPVLILAGAGSGKTRVLTHRIAYLIEEMQVPSYYILAITFTNKAANEMRERVDRLIGEAASNAWISTFHSCCLRILRRHGNRIGYESGFTIYDPEDQKAVIRRILKNMNLNEKMWTPRTVLAAISAAKNDLIGPDDYQRAARGDYAKEMIARLYAEYEQELLRNQAMDFDDILRKCVHLFAVNPDILEKYQDQFRYIMVDEYQDTNTAQYQLIHQLSGMFGNICVVGDDDQSIYKFRGANIRNILDFEKDFPDAVVIRLEENYRSTKTILNAANEVILHNLGRKRKTLWTQNETGEKITLYQADTEGGEAGYIAGQMQKLHGEGKAYKEMAILFRTNAQSRALEEHLIRDNIPYRLFAGIPFYQRKEIKDLLCYLRLIVNDRDYVAAQRIINVPKRGIGATTEERLRLLAAEKDLGITELIGRVEQYTELSRAAAKLKDFAALIEEYRERAQEPDCDLSELLESLITRIRYIEYLREEDPERTEDRLDNIEELKNRIETYEEESPDASLAGLIEELSLVSAIDALDETVDAVSLMTLHSAKGLEFPIVFLAGMEDGLFPSYMSITSGEEDDIEEERRLCYVGITRAQEKLYMTYAKSRRIHGMQELTKISRFIKEIPKELLDVNENDASAWRTERREKNMVSESGQPQRMFVKQFKNERLEQQKQRMMGHSMNEKSAAEQGKAVVSTWNVGDRVQHRKFGLGIVEAVEPLNADSQVTVQFAKAGTKKLLAGLAGLKKVE